MRLVTFQFIDRQPRVGVLLGGAVIDLAAAAPLVFEDPPQPPWSLLDVLGGVPDGMGLDGAGVSEFNVRSPKSQTNSGNGCIISCCTHGITWQ